MTPPLRPTVVAILRTFICRCATQLPDNELNRGSKTENKAPFVRWRVETTRHRPGEEKRQKLVSLRSVAAGLEKELPRNYALATEPRIRYALRGSGGGGSNGVIKVLFLSHIVVPTTSHSLPALNELSTLPAFKSFMACVNDESRLSFSAKSSGRYLSPFSIFQFKNRGGSFVAKGGKPRKMTG